MSERDAARTTFGHVAVAFAIAAICWACGSSATPTPSPGAETSPAASEEPAGSDDSASTGPADGSPEASAEGSTASPDVGPSSGPSTGPSTGPNETATVRFGAVPTKRWGDKPFKVTATASNGARLTYSSSGPACAIDASSGVVTIKAVGTCQLTARTAAGPAARDTASLTIRKGQPKITFKGKSVTYQRPFSIALKASSSLPITIKFRKASNAEDKSCRVQGTTLTLGGDPALDGLPQLRQSCTVQAYAEDSSLYETPKPVSATFGIEVPNVNIRFAGDPDPYSYGADASPQLDFTESSHGVGGVVVDDVSCDQDSLEATVTPGPTVSPGRTVYHLNLVLQPPTSTTYRCTVTVKATPPDYQRNQQNFQAQTTITVVE
jgi:hypothetical protein